MVMSTFAGIIVACILLTNTGLLGKVDHFSELVAIFGGTLFLAIVSFLDDHNGLPVFMRFGFHLVAACGVVFGGNVVAHMFSIPGLGIFELGWPATMLTLAFLLWMTNLYNFMDGMDGFAGGMTVVGFGLMGYFFWIGHHPILFGMAVIQAAAATGFLLHNFPPARIFMGDVGSISTGFLAGCLIVLGCREKVFDLWVPLMVFSPFIIDATVTLLRRALRCEKLWHAHREHYYQRVVLSGWSHRRTVLAEYAVMAFCGMLALLYHGATEGMRLIILAAWIVLFLALAAFVSRLQGGAGVETVR